MRSKVFVSCGQRPDERDVAHALVELLEQRGFHVYLAVNAQTILEINARIIAELKNSDCYLFVNSCRERIGDKYRGSLFSHQELAIAYALGFDRVLVVNQRGVLTEGMLRYIGINTEEFAAVGVVVRWWRGRSTAPGGHLTTSEGCERTIFAFQKRQYSMVISSVDFCMSI
jgi:hypothetical protein